MKNQRPRIAFLIQIHKNPEQVKLLIDSLREIYDCCFFLHADKKSGNIRNQICASDLNLLPEDRSVDVRWGKFSQCEATLRLIDAALSSGQKFDYVWLISGQDLPIAGSERANLMLSDCTIPYIEVVGYGHPKYRAFAKRNDVYYTDSMLDRTAASRILRVAWKLITGGKYHTFPVFRRKFDVPSYFGSSWWCLPADCIKEMAALYNASDKYENYFRHAANPDESLFQTLFMQTSYAGRQRKILTYVDWTNCKASPRTLGMADFSSLEDKSRDYLLARKFDCAADRQIISKVLEELCGLHIQV